MPDAPPLDEIRRRVAARAADILAVDIETVLAVLDDGGLCDSSEEAPCNWTISYAAPPLLAQAIVRALRELRQRYPIVAR